MTPEERFWSKVEKTDGCWEWRGDTHGLGPYGRFSVGKARFSAHRWIYEHINGAVPKHLDVCHSCDNRLCVRPDHLWVGTRSENLKDAGRKGRTKSQRHPDLIRGDNATGRKLRSEQVIEIRRLRASGVSQKDVAAQFGVSPSCVRAITDGATWKSVVEPVSLPDGGEDRRARFDPIEREDWGKVEALLVRYELRELAGTVTHYALAKLVTDAREAAVVAGERREAAAERKWREYERDFILPCFRWAKEAGIDLEALVRERAGHNCVDILVHELMDRLAKAKGSP